MNRLSKNEEKIKETLNSQQFEYDPTAWEAVEKQLPAEEAKRSRFKAIWFTLPVLILMAGIINLFSPLPKDLAETTSTVIADEENTKNKKISPKQSNSSIIPVVPQTDNNANAQSYIETNPDINQANKINTKTTEKEVPSTSKSIKENIKSTNKEKAQASSKNTVTLNTKSKPNSSEIIPPSNKTVLTPNENNKSKAKTSTADKKETVNSDKANKKEDAKPNAIVTDTQTNVTDNNTSDEKEEAEAEVEQTNPTPPKQIFLKHSIAAVAGINYSRLLQNSGNRYTTVPYFGLQYQFQPNTKWQFNTGLGYSYVEVNGLEKQYTTEQYSFGLTTENTTINTKRLHYLEIPILVRYNAFNNFSLIGGTNFTYLLNTNNALNKTRTTTLGGKQVLPKTNENQFREGINSWDVQMQFGFEYKLNSNLRLGLLANTGLLDVSRNNYYNTAVFNRNSRLQLYIKYDFIRF